MITSRLPTRPERLRGNRKEGGNANRQPLKAFWGEMEAVHKCLCKQEMEYLEPATHGTLIEPCFASSSCLLKVECVIFEDVEKKQKHQEVTFFLAALFRLPSLSQACQ